MHYFSDEHVRQYNMNAFVESDFDEKEKLIELSNKLHESFNRAYNHWSPLECLTVISCFVCFKQQPSSIPELFCVNLHHQCFSCETKLMKTDNEMPQKFSECGVCKTRLRAYLPNDFKLFLRSHLNSSMKHCPYLGCDFNTTLYKHYYLHTQTCNFKPFECLCHFRETPCQKLLTLGTIRNQKCFQVAELLEIENEENNFASMICLNSLSCRTRANLERTHISGETVSKAIKPCYFSHPKLRNSDGDLLHPILIVDYSSRGYYSFYFRTLGSLAVTENYFAELTLIPYFEHIPPFKAICRLSQSDRVITPNTQTIIITSSQMIRYLPLVSLQSTKHIQISVCFRPMEEWPKVSTLYGYEHGNIVDLTKE